MAALSQERYTPAEYLALEREVPYKSEYINGYLVAMPGTSHEHNVITGNILGQLYAQLRGRSCEVYMPDTRIKISATGMYAYPDVVALCGEARFEDDEMDTLLNPMVIVEVLSPASEAYDRGEKLTHYRQLPALQDYVLVAQDQMWIEHYVRQGDQWALTELSDPDGILHLAALGCTILLQDIYERVTFPRYAAPRQ